MEQRNCQHKKMKYDCEKTEMDSSLDASSDESLSDEIIGNDSSDYNQRAKFGGEYMVQNIKRDERPTLGNIEFCSRNLEKNRLQMESLLKGKFELESTEDSDFSTNHETIEHCKLTSTPEKLQVPSGVKSQIGKIEMMFASFVKNSQHELQVLTNLIETPSNFGVEKQTMTTSEVFGNSESKLDSAENVTVANVENDKINKSDTGFEVECSQQTIVTLPILFEYLPNADFMTKKNVFNVDPNALNADEIVAALNVEGPTSNVDEYENGVLNAEIISAAVDIRSVVTAEDMNEQLSPNDAFDVSKDSEQRIKLPMSSIPAYKENEVLLDKEDVETEKGANMPHAEGLVEALLPLTNESEPKYMNRAIETLFDPKFFVDTVGWQTAEKRINIKGSYILGFWKSTKLFDVHPFFSDLLKTDYVENFENIFGPDDNNAKFMGHFRRYKSAKRAADKASEKKKNASSEKN